MATATTETVRPLIYRLVGQPLFWVAAVMLLVGWPIVRARWSRTVPPKLPVLGQLGGFAFVDQQGHPFGSDQLRGKVWVANFIFTRCPGVCGQLTDLMGKVQHRARNLGGSFHLVSYIVDPENDTPEALLAYARKHRVSPRMWSFLTGDLKEIEKTVIGGMKVSMGAN